MTEKKLYYHVKKPVDLSNLPKIEGYDFEDGFDLDKYIKALSTSGIQSANLGKAISIINTVIREKVPIFFSFTSNMISCGMREIIAYLAKHKHVAVMCTSAGGVEEDAIKAMMPVRVGDFNAPGEVLFDSGVGRIGNIYTTNEHYSYFEYFIREVFEELLAEFKSKKEAITPTRICWMMGKKIFEKKEFDHEKSFLYWAYKNKIPVFSPGIIDGAIGDIGYYFRKEHPEFVIDTIKDHVTLIDTVINSDKSAGLILGGGISKHYMLNAQIFKEGFDYAVYISTAEGYDASDSGGNIEEAITWAKVKPNALRVKVYSEASLAFPILVAGSFAKK